MARLLGFLRGRMTSPFARKLGAILVAVLVILFIANPELLSIVLFVELIGIDVLILLVGMQISEHWTTISTFIITPCCLKLRALLGLGQR